MRIRQAELPNGLRIVTANMAEMHSVTVNIAIGVGSRYEDYEVNGGVSHFLEHLLFKGSQKYPSAQEISEAVDAVGGYNNAYTAEDMTSFHIKMPSEHWQLALDILADIVQNPLLKADEVDRERDVVLEEMNVEHDDPARLISTEMISQVVFPGNPLGRSILGSERVIKRISPDEIREYMQAHYRPNDTVVSVAGQVDHEAVVARVKELFSCAEPLEQPRPLPAAVEKAETVVTLAKPTAQAHFIVGARGYKYDDKDERVAQVLSAILGRGMSSRLFVNVRERQGLAYTVYADHGSYSDTGIFCAYAGVGLDKADRALDSVLDELDKIRAEPVRAAELNKAKQQLKAGLEMGLESNMAVADRLANQLLFLGRLKSLKDIIAEIDSVTAQDVQRIAIEMLAPGNLRLAIIAPNPDSTAARFREIVAKKVK
jgi:predicted Zn-dependent peptidase